MKLARGLTPALLIGLQICSPTTGLAQQENRLANADLSVAADKLSPVGLLKYVNPMIGTAGFGHTYPGATVPFGMVQLSPDTGTNGWEWCSGYHYEDKSILGFSHTHLSGTGCSDLGDVLIAPTVGKVNLEPGTAENPSSGYRSVFSHDDEHASPGYYIVKLRAIRDSCGVDGNRACRSAPLSISQRQRFKSDRRPRGWRRMHAVPQRVERAGRSYDHGQSPHPWMGDRSIDLFAAEFSKPFSSFGVNDNKDKSNAGGKHAAGRDVKGWFTFSTNENEPIVVKVGLSTTSIDEAV